MSIDEIVSLLEHASEYPEGYFYYQDVKALIADWRKRGGALLSVRDADQVEMALDPEWPSRIAKEAMS